MLWSLGARCSLAGAAMALCWPKLGLCFIAWFAPALMLRALHQAKTPFHAAVLCGIFGLSGWAIGVHWVYWTCRFAEMAIPIALLAWGALVTFLALNWALYGALISVFSRKLPHSALPWVEAIFLVAIEFASAQWTPRLGGDFLVYTQWRYLPLLQATSWIGPHGLSFIIMLWNAALAGFWIRPESRFSRCNLAFAASLMILWAGYGFWVLAGRQEPKQDIWIEILQPNIDQYKKWGEEYESEIRSAFDELLSKPRRVSPSLIVWPEASLPGWLDEPDNRSWVTEWSKRLRSSMLVGSLMRFSESKHNSAVLLDAQGRLQGAYHKRQLVPFGEFVPFRATLGRWVGILAQMGDFNPGETRQPLLHTPLGPMAVTICYEAVFPYWSRLDASRGARVFANLTNDGWYRDTWGPYQHFYSNVFRAVENRVTVIRAANTGISAVIDPYGRIVSKSVLETQERLSVPLSRQDPFPRGSFYSRYGDWFGWLCLILSVALLLYPKLFKLKS